MVCRRAWRAVPVDASALGRPPPPRGPGRPRDRRPGGRRRGGPPGARRRVRAPAGGRPAPLEAAARGAGLADLAVPSASSPLHRLQGAGRRRPAARSSRTSGAAVPLLRGLPPALRDEHPPGMAARPAVPLGRPQRGDQHGPRQPRARPRPRRRPGASPRGRLSRAGPLLSPDGSDSLSLAEAVELMGGRRAGDCRPVLRLVPEAAGARARPPARRRDRSPADGRVPRAWAGRGPSFSAMGGGLEPCSTGTGSGRRRSR